MNAMSLSISQHLVSASGALMNGDHSAATVLLKSGLAKVKTGLGEQSSALFHRSVRGTAPIRLHALSLRRECPNEEILSSCPGSVFTFYDTAVVCDEMPKETEGAFAVELSAVILYNLGLAHHRSALMTGATVHFAKAIKFYNIAQQLSSCEDFSQDTALLKLAVWVNMGHILSSFYDQKGTERCVQGLSQLFHTVDANSLCQEAQQVLQENLFVAHSQHQLVGAPAA